MAATSELVHGTAIAVDGRAALIRGPSGAGKSDLALRCLVLPVVPPLLGPAELVADDQVLVLHVADQLVVRAPETIRGLLEVRGLGLVTVPAVASAELSLVVDLVAPEDVERLPGAAWSASVAGCDVPLVRLTPFEPSAPLKLLLALRRINSAVNETDRC